MSDLDWLTGVFIALVAICVYCAGVILPTPLHSDED